MNMKWFENFYAKAQRRKAAKCKGEMFYGIEWLVFLCRKTKFKVV